MDIERKNTLIRLMSVCILFLIFVIFTTSVQSPQRVYTARGFSPTIVAPTATPTPFNPFPYMPPKLPYSHAYLTMLVGDSIVAALGPNADLLRQHLIEYYPDHEFVNYNYGFGATSIETLPDRLNKGSIYLDQNYLAILSQGFDLIIIESFGYNPLSQLNEGEGLT